jgi:hypothetical protein
VTKVSACLDLLMMSACKATEQDMLLAPVAMAAQYAFIGGERGMEQPRSHTPCLLTLTTWSAARWDDGHGPYPGYNCGWRFSQGGKIASRVGEGHQALKIAPLIAVIQSICVSDVMQSNLDRLAGVGVNTTTSNKEVISGAKAVFIAVKPDIVPQVLAEISPAMKDQLIIR